MKRSIGFLQLIGFVITSIGGTIMHFLYTWFNEPVWLAPFSSVNESTWEHIKLLFWPMFIFAVIQKFFFNNREDFWCVKLRVILLGISLIPVIFYTYNGVIGKSPDWINITIFFVSLAMVYIYETHLFNTNKLLCKKNKFPLLILCIIALLFVIFTFNAPKIGIFKDPLTGTYGI